MSQLNIDTIQNRSGGPVTLTKQSAAKAWIFTTDKTSYVPTGSFNVSSITDNGVARPSTNFTNAFNNANIAGSFDGGYNRLATNHTGDGGITTTSFAHYLIATSGSQADVAVTGVGFGASYLGDLA